MNARRRKRSNFEGRKKKSKRRRRETFTHTGKTGIKTRKIKNRKYVVIVCNFIEYQLTY